MMKQTNPDTHEKHNPFSFFLRTVAKMFENVIVGVWTLVMAAGAVVVGPLMVLEDMPALRRYVRMSRM
jgi:hypothetical protein